MRMLGGGLRSLNTGAILRGFLQHLARNKLTLRFITEAKRVTFNRSSIYILRGMPMTSANTILKSRHPRSGSHYFTPNFARFFTSRSRQPPRGRLISSAGHNALKLRFRVDGPGGQLQERGDGAHDAK